MARVRVGGTWLHGYTRVADLRWRHGADGGCVEASWQIGRRPSFIESSVLVRGARVEIFAGFQRVWVGVLAEGGGRSGQCVASGLLAEAQRYEALDGVGAPTDDVSTAITTAVNDGWPAVFLGSTPTNTVPSEKPQRLHEIINLAGTANSQRATVRADGILRWESDPTTPFYVVLPGIGALGRTDEEYATRVSVRYVASVSGTPPVADAFDRAVAVDSFAESIHGRSTVYVDVTDRGLLTATEAGWIADGILAKFGARLGFGESVTLAAGQIRDVGGSQVSLASIEAGRMVRFLGVRTPAYANTASFDVVIGSTDYTDGSGQITLAPIGTTPRNLADVIASIPTIHTALNPAPGAGAVQAA